MFQKNFCKISSKDSSRYFAIIIPSVLSVFEEIKNLKNIFLQRRFFFKLQNIITTSYHQNQNETKNLGVEKKIFDICEHYSYITFSVVIKIFQKKLVKSYFCFFVQLSLFFLQKIPSNQHPPPKNLHRPAIICGIITNQIWLKLANLPKWWPQMPNWQDLNISWMKRTAKMKDFGLVWDTMPKDLKLWQSQLII